MWEIKRLLKELKENNQELPKYLLLENVKAILSYKHKKQFNEWLKCLEEFGYESKCYCLNATDFQSCQNRERVFVISVLKDFKTKVGFEFPIFEKSKNKLPLSSIIDIKNKSFESKFNEYELTKSKVTSNNILKYKLKNYTSFSSENYVYDINHSGPTLTASGAMSRIKLYFNNDKIRYMSPLECFKYMGFTQKDYRNVVSTKLLNDSKMIYLCGNSIVVNVLEAIFKSFKF